MTNRATSTTTDPIAYSAPSLRKPAWQGFTLLEVLVALVVVSIALSTMIKATGDIANNTHYMRQKAFAHWVAMNRMAELRIDPRWLDIGTDSGEVENNETHWKWIQKVESTPDQYIRHIEIRVIPIESGHSADDKAALATLSGYILNPEVMSTIPYVANNGILLPPLPPLPPNNSDANNNQDNPNEEPHNDDPKH